MSFCFKLIEVNSGSLHRLNQMFRWQLTLVVGSNAQKAVNLFRKFDR